MPQSSFNDVVAHWSKLAEGFSTAPRGFYESVELALAKRHIPGLKTERVTWDEGGMLDSKREYLRINGERHTVDVCAAPYGTGFFFSSWTTPRRVPGAIFYLVGFGFFFALIWFLLDQAGRALGASANGLGLSFLWWSFRTPFVLGPLSAFITLWLIALSPRGGNHNPELVILTVPLLGWAYQRLFAPITYYRYDTLQMFHSAVHAAVLEALDRLFHQKGLRALAAEERKPVFREMLLTGSGASAPPPLDESESMLRQESPESAVAIA